MLSKVSKKGFNVILAAVLAGMGTSSYIPVVYAEGTTAVHENQTAVTLSNLEIKGMALDQSFSPDVTEYTKTVEYESQTIYLKVESSIKDSSITINGQPVTSGTETEYSLQSGENKYLIVVSNENGETTAYTLRVIRKAKVDDSDANINTGSTTNTGTNPNASTNTHPGTGLQTNTSQNNRSNSVQMVSVPQNSGEIQKVSKAKLSSLTVSEGTWDGEFSEDEYTYHVAVGSDVNSVTINPAAAYSSSSILIEGGKSKTIQLEDGKKTIISVVVTYDDDDRKTYVIVFDKDK